MKLDGAWRLYFEPEHAGMADTPDRLGAMRCIEAQVPGDAGMVLPVVSDHGGHIIPLPAPGKLHRQILGKAGLAVFRAAGDKDDHLAPSTENLSPSRISSKYPSSMPA